MEYQIVGQIVTFLYDGQWKRNTAAGLTGTEGGIGLLDANSATSGNERWKLTPVNCQIVTTTYFAGRTVKGLDRSSNEVIPNLEALLEKRL